jgi:hypothetical protein
MTSPDCTCHLKDGICAACEADAFLQLYCPRENDSLAELHIAIDSFQAVHSERTALFIECARTAIATLDEIVPELELVGHAANEIEDLKRAQALLQRVVEGRR